MPAAAQPADAAVALVTYNILDYLLVHGLDCTQVTQISETLAPLGTVPPDRETWAYAPGMSRSAKFVGHIVDVERVFAE